MTTGSRRANLAHWLVPLAVALALAVPAQAAEPAVGPPTPLVSPSLVSPSMPTAAPTQTAQAAPAKRPPMAAVRPVPVQARPLIPPANLPARLGPPPAPRPALSLETDLQRLGAPPQATPAATTPPVPAKPPAG